MTTKRDPSRSGSSARAFLVPLVWIAALLASYWVMADWQTLPGLISTTLGSI